MLEHITRGLYYFGVHLRMPPRLLSGVGFDIDPAWKRHDQVLDLGGDGAQFYFPSGCNCRQILDVASLVGHAAEHHRRGGKSDHSKPHRRGALRGVVAWRNPDVYATLFADKR